MKDELEKLSKTRSEILKAIEERLRPIAVLPGADVIITDKAETLESLCSSYKILAQAEQTLKSIK